MEESSRGRFIAVSAVAAAVLVILNAVLAILLLLRSGSVEGAVMGTRLIADRLSSLEAEVKSLSARVDALGAAPSPRAVPSPPQAAARAAAAPQGAKGVLAFTFDGDIGAFRVPRWATGSIRYTNEAGWFGRKAGALLLGYVYGPAGAGSPAAVSVPVALEREPRAVRVGMRARAADALVAIGLEEKGGALYEKRFVLRVTDGWMVHRAALAEMQPVEGTGDADGTLSWSDVASLYVADRTSRTEGGNVLALDDITVEFAGD